MTTYWKDHTMSPTSAREALAATLGVPPAELAEMADSAVTEAQRRVRALVAAAYRDGVNSTPAKRRAGLR